ncbi:MAG: peptidylprolyl isomerase [Cytophagales bacterium]|nr:peptidylprolyl isomerase [Cytophagales bacterium]
MIAVDVNKVVSLTYKLSISEQDTAPKVIETVTEQSPMYILFGNSGLPLKFEQNIFGMTAGNTFKFAIKSEDAFGTFDPKEVVNLPFDNFTDDFGKLDNEIFKVGKILPMVDEDGTHTRGRILEINTSQKYIRMDFNHPLAGKNLHFEGKILNVRTATQDEIAHGHVHGEGGHHH